MPVPVDSRKIAGTKSVVSSASSTGFSHIFSQRKERLGDWERTEGRERELVVSEEFERRERWEGEKERKKSLLNTASKIGQTVRKCENRSLPLFPMIPCAPPY